MINQLKIVCNCFFADDNAVDGAVDGAEDNAVECVVVFEGIARDTSVGILFGLRINFELTSSILKK